MVEVLRSGRLALGPKGQEFERLVAAFTGSAWAVAVSSGTAGLHLAVRSLGIGPEDCVVTSSFSFIASANCLRYEEAEPVFVDVDPETLCLSPDAVRAYLVSCKEDGERLRDPRTGRRVAGVLPVDVFGQPANLPEIGRVAAAWNLPILSDSCEAFGSRYRRSDGSTTHAGRDAAMAILAFYPNKQITTGEGGMVVGDDPDLEERVRSLRNQGRRTGDAWLHHSRLGFNYRMDELSAALGVAQMRRIGEILRRRAEVAAWYEEDLAGMEELRGPRAAPGTEPAWFVMFLRVATGISRDRLVEYLVRDGIESKAYFDPPIHRQPPYSGREDLVADPLEATEVAAARTLIVPFHARLEREDVSRVVRTVKDGLVRSAG